MCKGLNPGIPTGLVGPRPTNATQTTTESLIILYSTHGKRDREGPESVGLIRKPDWVYGLFLEEDDDNDEFNFTDEGVTLN